MHISIIVLFHIHTQATNQNDVMLSVDCIPQSENRTVTPNVVRSKLLLLFAVFLKQYQILVQFTNFIALS